MDLSKTVYALVGVLVAVLIVATVAVPVIENAQDSESTKHNNLEQGLFMQVGDADVKFTTSFTGGATSFVINGETFERTHKSNYLLVSDIAVITVDYAGTMVKVFSNQGITEVTTETITLSVDGKHISIAVDGTSLVDGTAEWVSLADLNGTHVLASPSIPMYVNSVEDVFAYAYTQSTGLVTYHFGEMTDGYSLSSDGLVAVDGFTDLYTISTPVMTNGNSTVSLYTVFVPVEVSGHTETNNTHIALLGAALLMLFLVPLMMVVNMIRGRSD